MAKAFSQVHASRAINPFQGYISCVSFTWVGLPNDENLASICVQFDLDQSERKPLQVKPWLNGVASRPKFSTCVYLSPRLVRALQSKQVKHYTQKGFFFLEFKFPQKIPFKTVTSTAPTSNKKTVENFCCLHRTYKFGMLCFVQISIIKSECAKKSSLAHAARIMNSNIVSGASEALGRNYT